MDLTEYFNDVTNNFMKKLLDEQEAYLQSLFGEGGPLEGRLDEFVLEENPPQYTGLTEFDAINAVSISIEMSYSIRLKTPEERNAIS